MDTPIPGAHSQEKSPRERSLKEAWIGDAVLSLYVRSMILKEDGRLDGPKCVRMTSNQFLNCFGEPTEVEAELGRVYDQEGLEAAFSWIEQRLLPLFRKHEEKRMPKYTKRPKEA